ncbi:hypothetical protein OC834_001083 [Tilletia horrida]|nr:hypothetical protein OC834_001083 [Tilletia horrida]
MPQDFSGPSGSDQASASAEGSSSRRTLEQTRAMYSQLPVSLTRGSTSGSSSRGQRPGPIPARFYAANAAGRGSPLAGLPPSAPFQQGGPADHRGDEMADAYKDAFEDADEEIWYVPRAERAQSGREEDQDDTAAAGDFLSGSGGDAGAHGHSLPSPHLPESGAIGPIAAPSTSLDEARSCTHHLQATAAIAPRSSAVELRQQELNTAATLATLASSSAQASITSIAPQPQSPPQPAFQPAPQPALQPAPQSSQTPPSMSKDWLWPMKDGLRGTRAHYYRGPLSTEEVLRLLASDISAHGQEALTAEQRAGYLKYFHFMGPAEVPARHQRGVKSTEGSEQKGREEWQCRCCHTRLRVPTDKVSNLGVHLFGNKKNPRGCLHRREHCPAERIPTVERDSSGGLKRLQATHD